MDETDSMLPVVDNWETFDRDIVNETVIRPSVEALCRELGTDTSALTRYEAGSRPVYAIADQVLKLYPQADANAWPVEGAVLKAVDGALPVAAPRVHAIGEWDGWGYLLMSRLPGVPLDVAWPSVPASDREMLAGQVGELLAALHRIPPPEISGWYPDMPWASWVSARRAACQQIQQTQRDLGLAAEWADQIPAFLDSVTFPDEEPVLLHTEVMRQHLLAQADPWRLTGLIDFEPAMRGAREPTLDSLADCWFGY
jgi:hygromycin-B 7''-O-kinase